MSKNNQQLYKGSLQTIILELLHHQENMYGYEITQKVKEISNNALQITEGALYPALHKLEADGFVETEVRMVKNRKRKYYKLTDKGIKEKTSRVAALKEYMTNMQTILNFDLKLS